MSKKKDTAEQMVSNLREKIAELLKVRNWQAPWTAHPVRLNTR
jgi:hypothetical protein